MNHPVDPADAAAVLAALDDVDRRVQQAYADGYRDGHRSGWDVGHAHAREQHARERADLDAAWNRAAAHVRLTPSQRTTAERAEMDASAARGEPCPARCERCSRCIRAAAVAQRGGDYAGAPAAEPDEYETADEQRGAA